MPSSVRLFCEKRLLLPFVDTSIGISISKQLPLDNCMLYKFSENGSHTSSVCLETNCKRVTVWSHTFALEVLRD
jgi:hypothetical protein